MIEDYEHDADDIHSTNGDNEPESEIVVPTPLVPLEWPETNALLTNPPPLLTLPTKTQSET